jgi:hypothetical protein
MIFIAAVEIARANRDAVTNRPTGLKSLKAQWAMLKSPNTHHQIYRKERQCLSLSHNQTPMRKGDAFGGLRRINSLG